MIPLKTGKLSISHIEWTLFDLVYCQFNLLPQPEQKENDSELLGGNEVHSLLKGKENQFIFNISDESGELQVEPEIGK